MGGDEICEELNDVVEPWICYLNKEMAYAKQADLVSYPLAMIIQESLLDKSTTVEAARHIDSYYHDEYLASDPWLKFLGGRGTTTFLCNLYTLVFDTACYIPYEDPHQDTLVELLMFLYTLPQLPRYIPHEDPELDCRMTIHMKLRRHTEKSSELWNVRCSLF